MRILDKKNSENEIVGLVLNKARYQKVVLCLDENSDMDFIDNVINGVGRQAVLLTYYYNKNTVSTFYNMVNNGARIIIYNVKVEYFYQLQTDNNYILNIFLPQSNFVLPYISNVKSVYGDNLLICDTSSKDYITLLFMYELALQYTWCSLLQDMEVDTTIFKNIDAIANGKCDFYSGLTNQMEILRKNLSNEYRAIEQSQLPYYLYLELCAIFKMLESMVNENEQYVDFYKTALSVEEIEKAHNLLVKHNILATLKQNSGNMLRINSAILNRVKIITKKHFNFKNIKLNNLNKIIKNQAKKLSTENLLYIAYVFNSI